MVTGDIILLKPKVHYFVIHVCLSTHSLSMYVITRMHLVGVFIKLRDMIRIKRFDV